MTSTTSQNNIQKYDLKNIDNYEILEAGYDEYRDWCYCIIDVRGMNFQYEWVTYGPKGPADQYSPIKIVDGRIVKDW